MIMLDCRYPLTEIASRASLAPTSRLSHARLQSPTFTFQLPFYHRCARDFYQLVDKRVDEGIRALSASIIKENLNVMFDGAQAGLLMEKNRLREALEISLSVKNGVSADLSPEFAYAAFIMTAEIYLLLNQPDQYEENLKEAHRYIDENACHYLLKNLSAYEVRKDMWDGDQRAAAAWLDNYYVDDVSFTEFYKIYRNFSTVRAYILTSQIDKAVPALDKIRTLAVNYDRPLDVAEADVLRCIADWILGNKKEARDRLYRLLSDVQVLGFVRVVANEGQAVLPIITSVLRKMEKEGDAAGALYRFVKDVYFTALEQARRFKGIAYHAALAAVKLSARQRDVLELLAQGRTNAEIIEMTGLTLNTIRTHTRILYQKLEVGSAADAVVKARQLGLI
ncbi:MAG: LuxR C-terminal-related transcriptional regulator [Clostridiaceae bacterium]